MPVCPRCEHEQTRHTIVDVGCSCGCHSKETEDAGPQPDEMVRLQQALDATEEEVARLQMVRDATEREIDRLRSVEPLVSQALARREMPSWRYAHYYGSDERKTNDLLREALDILRVERRSYLAFVRPYLEVFL